MNFYFHDQTVDLVLVHLPSSKASSASEFSLNWAAALSGGICVSKISWYDSDIWSTSKTFRGFSTESAFVVPTREKRRKQNYRKALNFFF
jgi:hypothetical protein